MAEKLLLNDQIVVKHSIAFETDTHVCVAARVTGYTRRTEKNTEDSTIYKHISYLPYYECALTTQNIADIRNDIANIESKTRPRTLPQGCRMHLIETDGGAFICFIADKEKIEPISHGEENNALDIQTNMQFLSTHETTTTIAIRERAAKFLDGCFTHEIANKLNLHKVFGYRDYSDVETIKQALTKQIVETSEPETPGDAAVPASSAEYLGTAERVTSPSAAII